ncbi:MAG: diguanylate cyclase [Clostridia bacterium]|nr:diguanylate cyclase [Clostridia bacterium]
MKSSIRKKTIIMIIVFTMVLIVNSVVFCGRVMARMIDNQYSKRAEAVSSTVAQLIDADQFARVKNATMDIYYSTENKVRSDDWGSDAFNEYTARFASIEASEDFIALREFLRKIQDVNGVDCIYLACVEASDEAMIYVVDAAYEDACPPGCIDPVFDVNREVLTNPERGFPAYKTNTEEYGHLMTAGVPVHDSNGTLVGYALTDISMDEIVAEEWHYIFRLTFFLLLGMLYICVASIIIINKILVKPIRLLSKSAAEYCSNDSSMLYNGFADIKINTHDEIEELANSMKQMENDINAHISELRYMNTELSLSKTVVTEMTELANTDALTGVRNKTAYDSEAQTIENEIGGGNAEFGLAMIDLNFLKFTNDTYGHESGNEAIVDLSAVICEVFAHSPVYRIGGDEFVVVLKGSDLENVDALAERFNSIVEKRYADASLEPWRRISAAIGYAVFDPTSDVYVADVFKRADHAMYDRKKAMKEGGVTPIRQA